MRHAEWDVFISYARCDVRLATRLCDALTAGGLRVFLDHRGVEEFTSISESISAALAASTLMVALYTREFPASRACDYELNSALIAGQHEGDPCGRIVVVNPYADFDHVDPIELRDIRSLSLADYADDLGALADRIARYAAKVGGVIGPLPDPSRTPWYPSPPRLGAPGPGLFRRQHWAVHSALLPGSAALLTGVRRGGIALVSGMPRAGTTTFAEEYALRFGGAYPGGVFWIDLGAGAGAAGDAPWEAAHAAYLAQVDGICRLLGDRSPGAGLADRLNRVQRAMARDGRSTLWVVDGLPDGLPPECVRMFRNPHAAGSTLIVARAKRYEDLGVQVDLGEPDQRDALELLVRGHRPVSDPESDAARGVVRALGGHLQALTAARRLRSSVFAPPSAYQDLYAELRDPTHDALEHDPSYAELVRVLCDEVAAMNEDERMVLMWAGRHSPRPIGLAALGPALAAVAGEPPENGRRRAVRAITELGWRTYVRVGEGTLRVHPLLARIVLRHFGGRTDAGVHGRERPGVFADQDLTSMGTT